MKQKTLLCYAYGRDDQWQAICVDWDIAVHGDSFDSVKDALETALVTYIEDIANEDEETRNRLFNRRSPFHVRARHWLAARWYNLTNGGDKPSHETSYQFHCPA